MASLERKPNLSSLPTGKTQANYDIRYNSIVQVKHQTVRHSANSAFALFVANFIRSALVKKTTSSKSICSEQMIKPLYLDGHNSSHVSKDETKKKAGTFESNL